MSTVLQMTHAVADVIEHHMGVLVPDEALDDLQQTLEGFLLRLPPAASPERPGESGPDPASR